MRWELLAAQHPGRRQEGTSDAGPGAAVPPTGARAPSPALQGLFALVIYLAVFIVAFGLALVGGLGVPRVGQNYVDPNLFIWLWRWWPYAVSHGLNPL